MPSNIKTYDFFPCYRQIQISCKITLYLCTKTIKIQVAAQTGNSIVVEMLKEKTSGNEKSSVGLRGGFPPLENGFVGLRGHFQPFIPRSLYVVEIQNSYKVTVYFCARNKKR